jgi:hypothetical protein
MFFCEESKIAAPSAADAYPSPPQGDMKYKIDPRERLASLVMLYESGVAALPEAERDSFPMYLPVAEWPSPTEPVPTVLGGHRHLFWDSFLGSVPLKYTAMLYNIAATGTKAEILRRLMDANVQPLALATLLSLRHRTKLVKAKKADPGPSALPLFPPASAENAQSFGAAAAAVEGPAMPAPSSLAGGDDLDGGSDDDFDGDDHEDQDLAQRLAVALNASKKEVRDLKAAQGSGSPAMMLGTAQFQELLASLQTRPARDDGDQHDELDASSALTKHLRRLQRTVDTRSVFELSLGSQAHLDKIVTQVSSGTETRTRMGGGFFMMGGGSEAIKPSAVEKFNYVNLRQGMDKYLLLHLESKVFYIKNLFGDVFSCYVGFILKCKHI